MDVKMTINNKCRPCTCRHCIPGFPDYPDYCDEKEQWLKSNIEGGVGYNNKICNDPKLGEFVEEPKCN